MAKTRVQRKQKEKKTHFVIKFFIFLIILISITIAYAHFIEPKMLTAKDYLIKNEKITENFNGFKIIQISDIHYGRMFGKEEMQKLVKRINDYKPDIVVLTGDLIDRDTHMTKDLANEIATELSKIEAGVGKYAVTGNHDYKFDEWDSIIKGSGFTNLNNTFETIYNGGYEHMVIAGISTMQFDDTSITERAKSAIDYINSFDKDGPIYKVLIMHEPDYIDKLENNKFDLVLAGHTHGGQIRAPFYGAIVLPPDGKNYSDGHYKVGNSDLYVSTGIGVSNVNFRLFDTPSFNVYRLLQK